MAYLLQNIYTKDFVDNNGDWTMIRSLAKRFPTSDEARKYMDSNEIQGAAKYGDMHYMKVIKESTKGTTMKYAKTFKENLQLLKEAWMPDSETISWLKDYLRDVKRGEGYVDIDKVVYDADIELNKDISKNKKDLADYIKRIGGGSILKESSVEERILSDDYGETSVFSDFGSFGVRVYMDEYKPGTQYWYIGYTAKGNSNSKRNSNGESGKSIKQILPEFTTVLKKNLENLDHDLNNLLKKYGFNK